MRGRLMGDRGWRVHGALRLLLILVVLLASTTLRAAGEQVVRTTLEVDHLTCGACLRVIDAELRKVPGILGLSAELPTRRVTVDHEPEVTPGEVASAITAAGYPARVLKSLTLPNAAANLFQRGPGFGSGPGGCNPGGCNPVADAWRELRRRFRGERGCEMGPDAKP